MRKHPSNLGSKFFYVESMFDMRIMDSGYKPPFSDHYLYLESIQWGGTHIYMVRDHNLTILHRGSYKHCRRMFNRLSGKTNRIQSNPVPMTLDSVQSDNGHRIQGELFPS
jgi:hypothetical protein